MSHSTGAASPHSQEELAKSGVTIAAAMGPQQCTASSRAQEKFSDLGLGSLPCSLRMVQVHIAINTC